MDSLLTIHVSDRRKVHTAREMRAIAPTPAKTLARQASPPTRRSAARAAAQRVGRNHEVS